MMTGKLTTEGTAKELLRANGQEQSVAWSERGRALLLLALCAWRL